MAHILVIDDYPEIRDFCAVVLRDAGHHVVLADNGQSALDIHTTLAGAEPMTRQ